MSHQTAGGGPRIHVSSSDEVEVRVADVSIRSRARTPSYDASFTRRQSEILTLVADGASNTEIAEALGISRRTVEKHLEMIHAKVGTATRARLVAFARTVTGADKR